MKKTAILIALSIFTLVSVSMLLTNYSDNVKYDSNKVHRATWIVHATILMQYQGINFLTDPD